MTPYPAPGTPIVIVGGGPAGQRCAQAYREAGGPEPVLLLSADDRPPYERPQLTKEYLRGDTGPDDLPLVPAGWYEEHRIDLRLGTAVASLDTAARTLSVDGDTLEWSACVLATGSHAGALPAPGSDDPELLIIRRVVDADRLVAAVTARPGPVAVIGSGFIGCEAAVSLRARGLDVVMLSDEDVPQQARLGPAVGAFLASWLDDAGVVLRAGRKVQAIRRDGAGWHVHVEGDEPVVARHTLMATGAEPNVVLAVNAGLEMDDGGVVVDSRMRASAPGVWAVGDIAAAWNDSAGRRLRVEHWGDALAMGAVAGADLAGAGEPWAEVPGFWSTMGDRELKHAAWGDGWDDVRVEGGSDGFVAWYGRNGVTVGVLTHRRDDVYDRGTKLVRAGAAFPPPPS